MTRITQCDGFIKTTEKSSMGHEKDSCIKCGRIEEAHEPVTPEIHIYFGTQLYKFKNWEKARENGFYLY